jgi:two-component system osmolarity sensor histidine kinase EnvZ
MFSVSKRLAWLSSGLFWRTFFLLSFLITASLAIWVSSIRVIERTPRAEQIAAQIVSIVTVTRVAITNSAPDLRRELLIDLANSEGIKIFPLEDNNIVKEAPDNPMASQIETNIRAKLGPDTRFAGKINNVDGFWVSFDIEGDLYWLGLKRERIEHPGIQWLGWAGATLIISMLGAVFISRLINQPLARLTAATHAIAKGNLPEPLPEQGPEEIREANRSFNQMVADLSRIESDRTLVLAGISHDLRTPLARLQLEVEMAHLSDDARQGMLSDLNQMDAIIGQFLDYAKPADNTTHTPVNLSALLFDCAQAAERMPDLNIHMQIADNIMVMGNKTELKRAIDNLLENTRRYGKTAEADVAELDISCSCSASGDNAIVNIADHGPGVPEADVERLLRPFTRMDTARGQANGAGLGLAIVNRIIQRHNGKLQLRNRSTGGLIVEISIPKA